MDGSILYPSLLNDTATRSKPLRICIVSDAWHPQVNGVVRTLDTLRKYLKGMGHRVYMLTPKMFKTLPCPTYPEIRLSLARQGRIKAMMDRWQVDAVHIATEGPLGWAARRWCIKNNQPFTTAYHTAFPEYIEARTGLSTDIFYPLFRRFHAASSGVLVATATVKNLLREKGFENIVDWTRGVDTSLFKPSMKDNTATQNGPTELYVGRVAVEKNIEAFLEASTVQKHGGQKVVVGDGPALEKLRAKYPAVDFKGALFGQELADAYANANVFVFPSKTDTFGLVMIEALAAGTPVAAYPVQGPLDVLGADGTGPFKTWDKPIASLNDDLETSIMEALTLDRADCANFAKYYDWNTVAEQFLKALVVKPTLITEPQSLSLSPAS